MISSNFKFGRTQTLGIEPKNNDKVIIKIPLETGGFWVKEYLQTDLVGTVVSDFKQENHVDIPKDYFMDWNCKNKSLKMTDQIKTLIVQEIPTICFNAEMKKKPLQIQEEEIIPQVVGKPFSNPFEVYLFKRSDKLLKIEIYDENIINKVGLNNFSSSSSYCNGNSQLFISGGENDDGEMINKLWQIDLVNNNIYDPVTISPKKNHSMIFIPPCYVFVVGGNDKRTFYFDSSKRELFQWADLKIERIEPALQRIGNTLYCFDNVNKMNNGDLTFEKTDLNAIDPEWNLLYPKMNQTLAIGKLPQKFFGVAKDLEDNIIFLGGNMDNYTVGNKLFNYKYNPSKNKIETSDIHYRDFNFREKSFLPYNKNIDYILPDFNKQHPEVVFYVKNKSKIEQVNYKPNKIKGNILRGRNRSLFDSKYDFNMPSITFPNNLKIKNNIIKYKAEPKTVNPYASIDIHEPSFQEYDFNVNCKIEQPPPFKEPEIEANKGDTRLSIEIPDLNEKKEIQIDIKEEEKNDTEKPEIKLKAIPRPNSQNNRQYYVKVPKIPQYNNELTIPRFHCSVNDPGNELRITSRGKIYTSYTPREPTRIKSSHADYIIKSQRLGKEDLILPNFNYSVNVDGYQDYNLTPGGLSARNMNFNTPSGNIKFDSDYELTGLIPGINSKFNTPNVNIKGPNIRTDYSLSGRIPGVNANLNGPKIGLKGPNIKGPDFKIKGNMPGMNLEGPNINLKGPKLDTDFSGKIDGNIDIPNIDIKGPDYNLKGSIEGLNIDTPKIDVPSANIKLKGPKIDKPNINIDGNIPGLEVNAPKIDLPSGNIDLKGPKLNGPDVNIEGNIPGFKVNVPKIDIPSGNIDIKGPKIEKPDINIEGNIPGLKVKAPKIDLPSGNIDLKGPKLKGPDFNMKGSIDIPDPNINIKGPKLKGPDLDIEGSVPGLELNAPKIDIPDANINLKGPKIKGPNVNIEGNMPGINVKAPRIDIPSGNINIKGPHLKNKDYYINGFIPGMKKSSSNFDIKGPKIKGSYNLNINGQDINIKTPRRHMHSPDFDIDVKGSRRLNGSYNSIGLLPGMNIKGSRNMKFPSYNATIGIPNYSINGNINAPNIKLKGDIPDVRIKGEIPSMKIDTPSVDFKSPDIDLKGPDYTFKGSIPDLNIKGPKIDTSGNISLKGPKIKPPNINLEGPDIKGPHFNLSGNIPGTDINGPKFNVRGPRFNLNLPNNDFKLEGIIPGSRSYRANLDHNIRLEGPNIKAPDFNLKGSLPGINVNVPNIDANFKGPKIKSPEFDIDGKIKAPNLQLSSPDVKLNGPNINVPDIKVEGDLPNVKLKGPNINAPDIKVKGDIPDVKLKGPNIDVPDIKVKGDIPDVKLKGELPGLKIDMPKVDIKSPDIDLKGPDYNLKGDIPDVNINGPNLDASGSINLKGPNIKSPDLNLRGNAPKVNINVPKLDIPSAKVKVKGPNFNSPSFNLSGNINGINSNDKDFVLTGVIPSYRSRNANIEVKNYQITPDMKFYTVDPSMNINSSYNNNIKMSLNTSRGGSPGKRNFHGNLNDPNYLDFGEIKGSRRAFIPTPYDIKIPKKKNLQISGNNIIDERDVILQPPFHINPNVLLRGQIGPKPDRKSVHLTVSQMQIQPEHNINEINIPDVNVDIRAPKIENDINVDMEKDINIKGGEIDLNVDNKINNIGEIGGSFGIEGNKDIDIHLPKIEIKNEAELNPEIPKINIEKPKIEGRIKINKKEPTDLRFKAIKEIDDNNNIINININNEYNSDTLKNSVSDEENSSKRMLSSRRKKGKGLPSVGVKNTDFKSSKIDVAGRLDVDNVDVNNMKAANVGVNGVKLSERIIE